MEKIEQELVAKKYDEVSRFKTLDERRKFLNNQSKEMKVALWTENINRKTNEIEMSAEQKQILDIIKKKFVTVEFFDFAKGKSEEEAGSEYNEIINTASRLLGKNTLREIFVIIGDSKTLEISCG